jgi:hypothetical protein
LKREEIRFQDSPKPFSPIIQAFQNQEWCFMRRLEEYLADQKGRNGREIICKSGIQTQVAMHKF